MTDLKQSDTFIRELARVIDKVSRKAFGEPTPFALVLMPVVNGQTIFSVSGNLDPEELMEFLREALAENDRAVAEKRRATQKFKTTPMQ